MSSFNLFATSVREGLIRQLIAKIEFPRQILTGQRHFRPLAR